MINSMPGIINVLFITLFFYLLFGIFGVNYFKGLFYYCSEESNPWVQRSLSKKEIAHKWDCMNMGGVWTNESYGFDNTAMAIMTLFEMATSEGWVDVMWSGVDATEPNFQPVHKNQFEWVVFFIVFMIVGSLFVLNLFVGVVINTYNFENEFLSKLGRLR
jgi:hypothetical protein